MGGDGGGSDRGGRGSAFSPSFSFLHWPAGARSDCNLRLRTSSGAPRQQVPQHSVCVNGVLLCPE